MRARAEKWPQNYCTVIYFMEILWESISSVVQWSIDRYSTDCIFRKSATAGGAIWTHSVRKVGVIVPRCNIIQLQDKYVSWRQYKTRRQDNLSMQRWKTKQNNKATNVTEQNSHKRTKNGFKQQQTHQTIAGEKNVSFGKSLERERENLSCECQLLCKAVLLVRYEVIN